MKKICMFSIADLYGIQTGGIKRFKELYFYLYNAGYIVDLYCATDEERLKNEGVYNSYKLELEGNKKGFLGIQSHAIYLNNKNIYKKIRDINYDSVIAFDVPSTIGLCLAGVQNIVYFVRQNLIEYRKIQYNNLKINKIKVFFLLCCGWIMEGICCFKASLIISQCHYDINQIVFRHPLLKSIIKKKTKIQINNINPSWIKTNSEYMKSYIKEYDLIFIGNFNDERKGYKVFLDTMEILMQRGIYLKAVMLGDGDKLKVCKEKYESKWIHFTGFVENTIPYINKSRLMVVPSYADSCPNTILESLSVGLPVIGSNCSGIPELLNNKDWRFELDSISLADKIMNCFDNHNLILYANGQKKRANELRFNWGKQIENLILENLMEDN